MNASLRLRRYCVCLVALLLGFALAVRVAVARADEGAGLSKEETSGVARGLSEGSSEGSSGDSSDSPSNASTVPAVGYITILLTGSANGSGATMTGGQISLYRVAAVDRTDPSHYFFDTERGQFGSSSAVSGIGTMTKQELDAKNPTISEALEQEVVAKNVKPLQTVNIVEGEVTFPEVEEGLYLLMQAELSDADRKIRPFIISVPDDEGKLNVVAKPKPGAWDGIDPNGGKDDKKDDEKKDEKDDKKDAGKDEVKATGSGSPSSQKSSDTSAARTSGTTTTASTKTTPASVASNSAGLKVPATADHAPSFAPVAFVGLAVVVVGVCLRRRAGRTH